VPGAGRDGGRVLQGVCGAPPGRPGSGPPAGRSGTAGLSTFESFYRARHVFKLELGLRKKYGARRLEAACRRALAFENIRYRTVKNILEKGLDQGPLDERDDGQLELPFVEFPRFARPITDLFPRN
jgi:hypothetical protein